jgi:hypothetical protein
MMPRLAMKKSWVLGASFLCALVVFAHVPGIRSALAEPPNNLAPLLGTWKNVDLPTAGYAKVVITEVNGVLQVHTFGKCGATLCDQGTVEGAPYAKNVSANKASAFIAMYDYGFKATLVIGWRSDDTLVVRSFVDFALGDDRADYQHVDVFMRE